MLILSACDAWTVSPQPFPVWTAIPSRTPGIVTATPNIVIPTMTVSPLPATNTPPAITDTPSATLPPSATNTRTPFKEIRVEILGCNTGFDVSHGMGEVTNAYVVLRNTGTLDLPNSCGLLRAVDEDREHPDKTRCVDNLPAGYQVTLKLTVDSTYKQDTIIQVDVSSEAVLLARVDKQSCRDLDIVGPIPGDIGVVKPITP
jgi:hypothetical protein